MMGSEVLDVPFLVVVILILVFVIAEQLWKSRGL